MVAMMSEYALNGDEGWRGIWKWGADITRVEDWSSSINDATWLLPYRIAENDEHGGYFGKIFVIDFRVVSNIYCRSFRQPHFKVRLNVCRKVICNYVWH